MATPPIHTAHRGGQLGLALNGMLGQIESAATVREASLAELEASERKLRRFVADASHELRTPLAAVRASALVLLGDRDRLRQAVDNLLANVRAHTPSGSPAWVTLDAVERMARLEVADSGPGLETEQPSMSSNASTVPTSPARGQRRRRARALDRGRRQRGPRRERGGRVQPREGHDVPDRVAARMSSMGGREGLEPTLS